MDPKISVIMRFQCNCKIFPTISRSERQQSDDEQRPHSSFIGLRWRTYYGGRASIEAPSQRLAQVEGSELFLIRGFVV